MDTLSLNGSVSYVLDLLKTLHRRKDGIVLKRDREVRNFSGEKSGSSMSGYFTILTLGSKFVCSLRRFFCNAIGNEVANV